MFLYIILALLSFQCCLGQISPCVVQDTCSSCVNAGPFCGWCLDPTYQDVRCSDARELANAGCGEISIKQDHDIRSIRNLPFSNRRIARPQVLETKIRKGQTVTFTVSARVPDTLDSPSSISVRVVMTPDSPLSAAITADCSSAPQVRRNRLLCRSVEPGSVIQFKLNVTVNECFIDPWELDFYTRIGRLRGISKINVQSICECECEEDRNAPGPNDDFCTQNGRLICGQCECNQGKYGRTCECEDNGFAAGENPCVYMNGSICSGQGDCICGVCYCYGPRDRKFSGQYCECDDYSCDYFHGALCGGPERGRCSCGACECTADFTGSACGCPLSQETCVARNGLICNGRGSCDCGRCTCESSYYGPTCEDCPTCPGQCSLHKDCVECMAFGIGRISQDECMQRCTRSLIFMVDEINNYDDSESGTTCTFRDPDDCVYYFRYEHSSPLIAVRRVVECPGI